jgi:hypothetical protein
MRHAKADDLPPADCRSSAGRSVPHRTCLRMARQGGSGFAAVIANESPGGWWQCRTHLPREPIVQDCANLGSAAGH